MKAPTIQANLKSATLATVLAATCAFPAPNPAHIAENLVDTLASLCGSGTQVKLVWVQMQFVSDDTSQYLVCNTGYDHWLYNTGEGSRLVGFDSKEGVGRILDTGLATYSRPIIDRSGKFIIWNRQDQNVSYIMSWDGSIARKTLLSGAEAYVVATHYNKANGKVYVYAGAPTNESGNNLDYRWIVQSINRYELDLTTGAVVTSTKTLMFSGIKCTVPWTVAGDGTHAGGNMPWSDGAHIAVIPGTTATRVGQPGQACHANIAPDASLRFFHAESAHKYILIYGPSHTNPVSRSLITPLPGAKTTWDFCAPRWSNDVRYITVGCPFQSGFWGGAVCGTSPKAKTDWVQNSGGEFYLVRFNNAMDSISRAVKITDGDWRFRKLQGDAWLSTGEGPNSVSVLQPAKLSPVTSFSLSVASNSIDIRVPNAGRFTATLVSANGRIVKRAALEGSQGTMRSIRTVRGIYTLNVQSSDGSAYSRRMFID